MVKIKFVFIVFLALSLVNIMSSCTKSKAPSPVVLSECVDTVKFSTQILPMMVANCVGCHEMEIQNGFVYDNYNDIANNAEEALSAMRHENGIVMPQGMPALHDSLIQQFQCWILQGKQDN